MIKKVIVGLLIVVSIMVAGNYVLSVPRVAIEVAPESVGPITNTFLTSIILSIIIVGIAFIVGKNLKENPDGFQNIVEALIELLDDLVTSIAPKKWAATFFPIVVTMFIFLLFTNLFSLFTPLLGSFGFIHAAENGGMAVENITFLTGSAEAVQASGHGEGGNGEVMIVPLFRSPSSDLNLTFALAIISVTLAQIFGIWEQGIAYFGNFIRFGAFAKQGIFMGIIDFIIGLIEGVSEIAKIISFSFRLFGNIFAGEVILIVISSLVSFIAVLPFLGFEIFVGLIQAFIFFILSLVFFTLATQHHGEEH